ncbi:MAG: aminomethyl transferase family protein [Planctomycetes bacterium]|nr:aminomethyl transferase family protein [Planctomycetota bacterium]
MPTGIGYRALREGAGLVDLGLHGEVRARGADAPSLLDRLLTNSIALLSPGRTCRAALLTPRGKFLALMQVLALEDHLLLRVAGGVERARATAERLGRYVFLDDAAFEDASGGPCCVGLHGPRAREVLAAVLASPPPPGVPGPGEVLRSSAAGVPCTVVAVRDLGEEGFELGAEASRMDALRSALGAHPAVRPVDVAAWETARIEAGTPWPGAELDEEVILNEAGLLDAVSFQKGCYVGQEVVARIHTYGEPPHALVGLVLEGEAPAAPGTALRHDGRRVGRVTSSTLSPALGSPIAMAYVARAHKAPGTWLEAGPGATGPSTRVRVCRLPFPSPTASRP